MSIKGERKKKNANGMQVGWQNVASREGGLIVIRMFSWYTWPVNK
jgi:hypothetical protein